MNISALLGLFTSWFAKIIDFISGFFAFIPMTIYFLYAGVASLLDLFQYVIRKLAGLDVYYINGQEQSGDILTSIIRGILGIDNGGAQYSTLSTVFWSIIIFSVVLLVLATIIQMIKAHYNYDSKKSQPMTIISSSIKSLFTIAIVPIVTVFGLYLSEIILNVLDQLTSASSATSVTALYGNEANLLQSVGTTRNGDKIYASYDFFGSSTPTTQTTFSGAMFKIAARDCNRVRLGSFSTKTSSNGAWEDFGIFLGDENTISMRIDEAFASNLHTIDHRTCSVTGGDSWVLSSSYLVGGGLAWGFGLINQNNFSKYNVGMVYYYYNLWSFNYFIAFAGIAAFITLFINIVFGLITRLIMCIALFLIYSPLVGISPLDGGNAFKSWRKEFMSNVLMAYGTVVGMNLFFLILPFLDTLTFFNVYILDQIMRILFMLAGLVLVKKFMKLVGGFIGGADANDSGNDVAEGVKKIGMSSAKGVMGAAALGTKVGGAVMKPVAKLGNKISEKSRDAAKNGKNKFTKIMGGIGVGMTGVISAAGAIRNHNARKTLGKEKGSNVSEGELNDAAKIKQITKLGNISKAEAAKLYKDAGGGQEGLKAVYAANNEVAEKRIRDNVAKSSPGLSGDKLKEAQDKAVESLTDKSGLVRSQDPEQHKKLKAVGNAFLDLGGSSLKLAGDLSGITTTFKKNLEEAGVFDSAKTAALTFMQNIGAIEKGAKPDLLQTKKDKDDAEKDAAKAQREAMEESAKNSKLQLQAIRELTDALKKN